MMNKIGKFLVILNTAASLCALGLAAGIFFQYADWGWKEPRKELDYRVASEYDKRAAAAKELEKARNLVLPTALPAHAQLREAQNIFGFNHMFYVRDLDELQKAPGDLEIKGIKYTKEGMPELDSKGRPIGKPVLGE